MNLPNRNIRFYPLIRESLSSVGLLLGAFFFAMSLTPTLIPRAAVAQGVISGLAMGIGYGLGIFFHWLWAWFGMPDPKGRRLKVIQWTAGGICLLVAITFLWQANAWQNSIRELMGMEAATTIQPLVMGSVALGVAVLCLLVGRLFLWSHRTLARRLQPLIPRKVSVLAGLLGAFLLFWLVVEGILFSALLRTADSTYRQVDAQQEPEVEQPTDPMMTGSPASLLSWEDTGRQGRRFLAGAPSAAGMEEFFGEPVMDPIRVYAGMHQGETFDERARLALEELRRVGAFDRSVLVILTPTGTGWVDPSSIDPLEYLHRGDIATVAAQYSYLPSALALMVDDGYGAEMARALFQEVYGHWTGLPADRRPRLYLHGLSLGALNSDHSFDFYDIVNDPFDGALWVGPPFSTGTWRTTTDRRREDSPEWRPEFRDGSVVRFANQDGGLEMPDSEWGEFRIAFLQYASDPITFFSPRTAIREPDWMNPPRGPDVSDKLRWFPIVTMIQLAADMFVGTEAPPGYGHDFAVGDYVDCWVALTEPEGWSQEDLQRLKQIFEQDG